jgi:hypothetical protein
LSSVARHKAGLFVVDNWQADSFRVK